MKIGDWTATPGLNKTYREIRDLGQESNLAEMEAFGFTVIENALSPEQTTRARDAVVRVAEQRHKIKLDLEHEETHRELKTETFLLYKDPIFQEIALNPKALALMRYFLGSGLILASMASHVKGPGGQGLPLHCDTSVGVPPPFPPYAQIANCNYFLTDYTEERGALAMVPGSHRQSRPPTEFENALAGNNKYPHAIPIEGPAGSLCIFQGSTWHGSYPRQVPGLRLNLSAAYVRPYMAQLEGYRDSVPPDLLERHGGRDSQMAQLLGLNVWTGWHEEGPSAELQRKQGAFGNTWQ